MTTRNDTGTRAIHRASIFTLTIAAALTIASAPSLLARNTDDPPASGDQPAKAADNAKPGDASGMDKDAQPADPKSSDPRPESPKSDDKPGSADGMKSDKTAQDPEPRREPSYSEILKKLQEESRKESRGVIPPTDHSGTVTTRVEKAPTNAIAPVAEKLMPDGSRLVDRPGRLVREGDHFVYSFESRGEGAIDRPIRLLPNRLLEDMESYSENGLKPMVFIVSGEVTEYHGMNYLLIQKLLVRPDTGNLR